MSELSEKQFEDILCVHPELIEEGLTLKGRQVTLYGRRMDLLFEDRFKRKLIVELKIGPIKDQHIGQIMAYEGMLLSADDPSVRVMLVGNRVPPNIRKALDHHGIAWCEIPFQQLQRYLMAEVPFSSDARKEEAIDRNEVPKKTPTNRPAKSTGSHDKRFGISAHDCGRMIISQKSPVFDSKSLELSMVCGYSDGTSGRAIIRLSEKDIALFLACKNIDEATAVANDIYRRFGRIKKACPRRIVQNTLARAYRRPDLRHSLYRQGRKSADGE